MQAVTVICPLISRHRFYSMFYLPSYEYYCLRFRQPMPIKSSIKVYMYTCTLQVLHSLFLQTNKYFGNQMSGNEIIVQQKTNRQTCFVTGAYRTIGGH